jgi:hypothetical protein
MEQIKKLYESGKISREEMYAMRRELGSYPRFYKDTGKFTPTEYQEYVKKEIVDMRNNRFIE